MRPILRRGFACLIVLLTSALCVAADPFNTPKAGVPTMDSSLDQFIASAKRQAETGSPELKQLVAQLDPLRKKQQALLATRRTKEAELARLQSAGGDAKRIATLQQEIDACRSQLNAVDTQLQVLMYRIQPGPQPSPAGLIPTSGGPVPVTGLAPASGGPPRPIMVPGAGGPVPSVPPMPSAAPTPVTAPTPGLLTRTVPPEKIKTAADALARNPAPSAVAARTAANQILSASQPGVTSVEVDQLAQLILQLATQTNEAALQAELAALKQENEKKSGPPASNQTNNEIKFEIRIPPSGDQNRLQELQARQAKLEQARIELMKRSTAAPDKPSPVKK